MTELIAKKINWLKLERRGRACPARRNESRPCAMNIASKSRRGLIHQTLSVMNDALTLPGKGAASSAPTFDSLDNDVF